MAQVICGIIRAHDRIADHGAGNRKPGNEVLVLGKTRLQINAGIDNRLSIRGGEAACWGFGALGDGEDDAQASVAMPACGYASVPGNGAVSASFSVLPVGAGSGMTGIGQGDGA